MDRSRKGEEDFTDTEETYQEKTYVKKTDQAAQTGKDTSVVEVWILAERPDFLRRVIKNTVLISSQLKTVLHRVRVLVNALP